MYKVNFIIEELEKGNISDVFVKVYQNDVVVDTFNTSFISCFPFVKQWDNYVWSDGMCQMSAIVPLSVEDTYSLKSL